MSDCSEAGRSRTRLVSFLGTGRYEPTRHLFPDGVVGTETKYVCRALAEHYSADEVKIIATAEAKARHGDCIEEALRAANLPAPEFKSIPVGQSEKELWQQFEVVKGLLRAPAGTEICFDVTHAFRSQPFFAAAITNFVRAVDREPSPVKLFYAAFEAREGDGTPVWDLTPFVDLIDWTQDMMIFLRTGRSASVAERTELRGRERAKNWTENRQGGRPNLDRLGRVLRDFGSNLETVRTGDLLLPGFTGSAERLAVALQEARESAGAIPPLADVLDRVRCDMVEPLLGASDHLASEAGHAALAGLARLYLNMGRWAEAAAIVREGWIMRYAAPAGALAERNQRRASVDKRARDAAETYWNEEEGNAARRIAAVRNDIEHAGFKVQPLSAEALRKQIAELVDEFARLSGAAPPLRATGHPPVFVNLSNHPSEWWSPAQREAALCFAPEIRDWPFPSVPPEADTSEIAELGDRTVAGLIGALPGATHAMVQGEFTLVNAVVRKLQQRGIICLSATTRRDVVEEDGNVKTTRFEFVRFREYS